MIHHGDCVEVMAELPENSVDAIVCDPPYAFPGGFMGKGWDEFDGWEDVGFCYWLAGLVDGEGHFAIKAHSRGTHAPYFQLSMRADEEGTLNIIRRKTGIGTIRHEDKEPHPMVRWIVQDKAGCQRLVDLFDKFPLRAKKRLDYTIWREAVCEWTDRPRGNRWHGGTDNSRMADLRRQIMSVRQFADPAWSGNEYQDWTRLWAREAFRLLKPGHWLLAAGAPKRVHRMTAGLEDAGFEIRDMVLHCFASGFPKGRANLKPAYEPWVLARKPGPLRPLAIDECRIAHSGEPVIIRRDMDSPLGMYSPPRLENEIASAKPEGRWPANIVLTDPIFDGDSDGVVGGGEASENSGKQYRRDYGERGIYGADGERTVNLYGDTGTYSRFFLIPKAARSDREPNDYGKLVGGLEERPPRHLVDTHDGFHFSNGKAARNNVHPTVKPTELMRHLVRLVTPVGGVCLDPFLGSGTTAIAAEQEGFAWIGIEKEAEYVKIAEARLAGVQKGLGLTA